MSKGNEIQVAILMGSKNDWDQQMKAASDILTELGIPHESRVLSAHRTPGPLGDFMKDAESRGCQVFIAGAGGAAHLAGVVSSHTVKPVIGVPIESVLQGLDSLLSTVQMPGGIPVGTMAIGKAGATNAGLYAAAILSVAHPEIGKKIQAYRDKRAEKILGESLPQPMGFKAS